MIRALVRYGYLNPHTIETIRTAEHNQRDDAFLRFLATKILECGKIRNPIVCDSLEKGTVCVFGTSRHEVAKRLDIYKIPVLINDFVNRYPHFKLLHTQDDVIACFDNPPRKVRITHRGIVSARPNDEIFDEQRGALEHGDADQKTP